MARSESRLESAYCCGIAPVNADGLQTTQAYIHQLQNADFQMLKSYLSEWSKHYRGQSSNFEIRLGQQLQHRPPVVPQNANILNVIWWSLKFRFYAWRQHSLKIEERHLNFI